MIKPSSELQDLVLSCLIKDSYLLSLVKEEINESYFSSVNYRLIYKALTYYYNKYGSIPDIRSLVIQIQEFWKDPYGDLSAIQSKAIELYNYPNVEEDFAIEKITAFVRRNHVEGAIKDLLPVLQSPNESGIEVIADKLYKSMNVDFSKDTLFTLGNTSLLSGARIESVGTDASPTLVKSCIEGINFSLQFKAYKRGDLIMVVAAPGCFTGDTKVRLPDGTVPTMKELYTSQRKNFDVYSVDNDRNVVIRKAQEVILRRHNAELVMVTLDDGTNIRCTSDHLFMIRDGYYKRADRLDPGDLLMSMDPESHEISFYRSREVIDVSVLTEREDVYDVYDVADYNNFALDSGIFVHNCGKTSFLVNEGVAAATQGFTVLHVFLGDMTNYDGFIRYLASVSGIPQDDLVVMSLEEQSKIVQSCNLTGTLNRISSLSFAADELTTSALLEKIEKFQSQLGKSDPSSNGHFDVILVDYADNLADESDMMYTSGGNIYNKLAFFMRINKSVGIVASQPKVQYWGWEILPKESAAESSKKQHIIDAMITFGKPTADADIGSLFLPKVRRGRTGTIIRVKTQWEICRIRQINEVEYAKERSKFA